jgi:enolase-phosphatase E1
MHGIDLFSTPCSGGAVVTAEVSAPVRAILLDIEGTTTPLDFVYQVLFPYARSHAQEFLKRHSGSPDVRQDLNALHDENLEDARRGLDPPALRKDEAAESLVAYVQWLIDRDRKSTPLKSLQGKIWEEGYQSGELRSLVFEDVPPALERWRELQRTVNIFSSGSVLAQKLLFGHTTAGDLTPYLFSYFDTTVGSKTDPGSYQRIASTLQDSTLEMIFISDMSNELDAAKAAGLQTLLCLRPGNRPQPVNTHPSIRSFAEVMG